MTNERDEKIRMRAHEIWESEGRPEGRHQEHWERARQEIDDEAAQMASLAGSSPDPTQSAPTSRQPRGKAASSASLAPDPQATSTEAHAKPQGNMPSELGGRRGKKPLEPPSAKYRHPDDPNLTWSGRGRRPDWIREAVEAGRSLSDYEIGA